MGDNQDRVGVAEQATEAERPVATAGELRPGGATGLVLIGAVCGVAWAAGLRGLMAEIAGAASGVTWGGTFGWVLVPGLATGALLGWAEHLRRTGGRRRWRWLALSPLAFAAVVVTPDGMRALFTDGLGGGALMVPLVGMAGGYALSSRGPAWARVVTGLVALSPVVAWAMSATAVGGRSLALDTPRGAWVAVFLYSFLAVLALACAIPHRPVASSGEHATAVRDGF